MVYLHLLLLELLRFGIVWMVGSVSRFYIVTGILIHNCNSSKNRWLETDYGLQIQLEYLSVFSFRKKIDFFGLPPQNPQSSVDLIKNMVYF